MSFKKLSTVALLILSSCCAAPANAVEIIADLGVTHYLSAPCGNWYQCQPTTHYTLRLNAVSGSIGLYTDRSIGGWQIGAGFGNGGRVTSDAMIYDVDNCVTNCGPLSHMQGQGTDPYGYIEVRKHWDEWFFGIALYASRMSYENTNYDWYGGVNYSVGPLVSHIDHDVKTTYNVGLSAGYQLSQSWSIVAKLLPTAANNSQTNPYTGTPTWYRPVNSSSFGYSPFVGVEYSF